MGAFAANEQIEGRAQQGNVGDFGDMFLKNQGVKMLVQERDVIGAGEYVVKREPGGPEGAREPAARGEPL